MTNRSKRSSSGHVLSDHDTLVGDHAFSATKGVHVVYYVLVADDIVKIGTSGHALARMHKIQTDGRRARDNVLAVEFGTFDLERERHTQFAHLRIGKAERFTLAPDLQAHIDALREALGIAS
jgi:hypothetical protein